MLLLCVLTLGLASAGCASRSMGNPHATVNRRAAVLREVSGLPGIRRAFWDGRITVERETHDRLKIEIEYTADHSLIHKLIQAVIYRHHYECWFSINQQTKEEYIAELRDEIADTRQDLQLLGLLLSQKQLQLKNLEDKAVKK